MSGRTTNTRSVGNTSSSVSPDQKVIELHKELINEDFAAASSIMSTANSSADEAKKFAEVLPSLADKCKAVTDKVTEMKECFEKFEAPMRDARIAGANSRKSEVETKAQEVTSHLQHLKELDSERKVLFGLVEEKSHFKAAIEKIIGIQQGLQGHLDTANDQAVSAKEALDEARSKKLSIDRLPGQASSAETAVRDANKVVSNITTGINGVTAALTAARNASSSNNKAAATTALKNAEKASQKALKESNLAEKDESTTSTPPEVTHKEHGGTKKKEWFTERVPAVAAIAVSLLFAIALAIHGGSPSFLVPAIFMTLSGISVWAAFFPSAGLKGAGVLAGLLAMLVMGVYFFGWQLPGGSKPKSNTPTTPATECRTGWFDDPCKTAASSSTNSFVSWIVIILLVSVAIVVIVFAMKRYRRQSTATP